MAALYERIEIIYDGECPLCKAYVSMMQLRQACNELILTDARGSEAARQRAHALMMDLNEGFIVLLDDTAYHGAMALHQLAMLTSAGGWFNHINHWIFRSKHRAQRYYPWMVRCRNLALKLLGKSAI